MEASIVAGVDVGKSEHYVVALDTAGTRVRAYALPNEQRSIDELVGWANTHQAVVVVDQPTSGAALLIAACWQAGVRVGYLHGLAIARARDFYAGEAKTDPKDAFVIADVARIHPRRIVELRPAPEERATLELLCGRDEDLRADINRATNRLRQLLGTHWPALERVLGDRLGSRAICQLLAAFPGPQLPRRSRVATLAKFLRARRVRQADTLAQRIHAAIDAQDTVVPGAEAAAGLLTPLAEDLDRLLESRATIEREIENCPFAQPEAAILLSLPGIGAQLGARILVEIGEITRFPSPAKLAAYAGLGPSSRQSGTSINTAVPSRSGNHRLNNAMFLAAFASLHHPPSRTDYDRKRAEGKQHNEATLCLARRRVDVLHAMLTRRTPYHWAPQADPDPQTAAA